MRLTNWPFPLDMLTVATDPEGWRTIDLDPWAQHALGVPASQ